VAAAFTAPHRSDKLTKHILAMSAPIAQFTPEYLQTTWADLNGRYFRHALPPILILWSPRLTASMGVFFSRSGPRTRVTGEGSAHENRRVIRLSLPLFRKLSESRPLGNGELISTLAHEMIHQWQYDILKRRPNHGAEFRRMMHRMNQDGLGITVYHSLNKEVDSFARYVWRCQRCGYLYRRQRRTIQPRRHQCGACRGPLKEVRHWVPSRRFSKPQQRQAERGRTSPFHQLTLDFTS
jgi:predicted SprT family Zn-dependent metalloprotease